MIQGASRVFVAVLFFGNKVLGVPFACHGFSCMDTVAMTDFLRFINLRCA